ncbi:polyadenylate-binding protein-interacting protein 12 [Prunus yedoensis var. nudiflora]|uniref:Polyadenylate-binding protein-interacting protein 12 n=1 Tax=Prunus yedoensis var. nudiflora TaxID=2094558 RepID=A0A314YXF1_PRUYE|nr:polyadenylate-binding protein-interacting protein 12 [Prunus yedoensis var. nudiflora]
MAVVENAGVELGKSVGSASANRNPEAASQDGGAAAAAVASNDQDQSKHNAAPLRHRLDQSLYVMVTPPPNGNGNINGISSNNNGSNQKVGQLGTFDHVAKIGGQQVNHHHQHQQQRSNGGDFQMSNGDHHDVDRDMRELRELFSKLNPMAEEFVPPSLANGHGLNAGFVNMALMMQNGNRNGQVNGFGAGRRRNNQGKRRINSRTSLAQREDRIRRTVYVSDIDQQVTEEQLAALFVTCGQVVDCRICGDPNSVLRFAFIEFTDEDGARAALSLAGTMLGFYPVRVLPSKTAIAPVNPTFLPRTEDEREMCARTIYCTNIDKKVAQADVKLFFESVCGEVYRLRLLGDYHHSTRIAFVEFVMAESAIAALNCSGVVLGSLPIRVSPSKTPVRPRSPRLPIH